MVPITKCPPAPAHIRLKPEPQFSRQARPVTKDTEITFNDIERMQCYSHKGFIHMSGTDMLPEYVMSRRAFRRLLTRYVEVRAGFRWPQPSTEHERFQQAQSALLKSRERKVAVMEKLCHEYVAVRLANSERARELAIEIRTLDTVIRTLTDIPTLVVGVLYHFYCLGETSYQIAEALGLDARSVRQLLTRLKRVWAKMQAGEEVRMRKPAVKKCVVCWGPTLRGMKYCSDACREKRKKKASTSVM